MAGGTVFLPLTVALRFPNCSHIFTMKLVTKIYDLLLFQKSKDTVSLSWHMSLSLLMT